MQLDAKLLTNLKFICFTEYPKKSLLISSRMLSVEDSGKLFRKAHELNFNPFSDWLKRKAEAVKLKAKAYGIKNNGKSSASSSDGFAQTAQ